MDSTKTMSTPATALSYALAVTRVRPKLAPIAELQGTGLPFAGGTAAPLAHVAVMAAVAGVRNAALPAPVPRGALV